MEEVDRIIVHSLKDIGCGIDNEIEGLDQFSTELIVEAAVRCLETIQPGLGIPKTLPQNMAARFHVGATIAQACKDLGYNGDVGYQTFLYSNVVEVRRLFMFLVEKLPRDLEKAILVPDDPLTKLKAEFSNEVKKCLLKQDTRPKTLNIPFISQPLETGIIASGVKVKGSPKEWREYIIQEMSFVTEQVGPEHTLPSLIALNIQGLAEGDLVKSRDVHSTSLSPHREIGAIKTPLKSTQESENTWLNMTQTLLFTKDQMQTFSVSDSEANKEYIDNETPVCDKSLEDNGKEKTENDKKKLEQLRARIEELQGTINEIVVSIESVKEEYIREMSSSQDIAIEIQAREKALSLLPSAAGSIKKLEDSANSISQEILLLASQWEKCRAPLMARYMATRTKAFDKQNQSEENFERIKKIKGKIGTVHRQIVNKKTLINQLEEEYIKLPKNVNRSAYTHRIMEIIGNIKKQKEEIDKILRDTKDLQKEINSINGRLERSMAVTEETIFRNAKKDEFSKRAFKLLATLHSDCGSIVNMVLEIGTITREITDLREQIELESSKNTRATLERITYDLEHMRSETKILKNQLSSQNSRKFSPPL